MNIQDAIRSGKRFKRRCWPDWIERPVTSDVIYFHSPYGKTPVLGDNPWESLAADDWEIEEEAICITKSDFFNAYSRIYEKQGMSLYSGVIIGLLWEEMSKQKEDTCK